MGTPFQGTSAVNENERVPILRRIRRITAEVGGASDAQLLGRFAADRDEAAFELLVWRHARLVYGTCQRVLHDRHDAEDAFQATFLALARHAGRIARREAVAGWLHRVACRVALTARGRRVRREAREATAGAAEPVSNSPDAASAAQSRELRQVLDREIGRLPARFRAAVVLCYLEGKSVDEAAVLLGCPRGTVASRLARGRERLRARLAGRGLAVPAALASAARRPVSLIPAVTAAAVHNPARGPVGNGSLPPRVNALTEEVLRAMFLRKLTTGVAVLAVLFGLVLAGGGLAVGLRASAAPDDEPPATAEAPKPEAPQKKQQPKEKPAEKRPRVVTVVRPVRRGFTRYDDFTGRLDARRSIEVRPAVSGFVQKVNFKAGDEVKQGDVLFELDSRVARLALDKAEANLTAAEAKKKLSDADLARGRTQVERNAIGREEFDQITERAVAADAGVRAARSDVARARLDLESTRVTAPMSGQVGRPLVEPGSLVFPGPDRATLLTTVMSLDPIAVVFDMDEASFLFYRRLQRQNQEKGPGSPLQVGVAQEEGCPHTGTLDSFGDQVTAQATVQVRGTLPNPGKLLLPGMNARVRMRFGPPRTVLEVPEQAISHEQGRPGVLVIGEGNVARQRTIKIGLPDDGMRVVEDGLGVDDRVAIDGPANLRPGDVVEPREAAAPEHKGKDR